MPGIASAGGPPAMDRPVTVRAGLGAVMASLILSVIASVYQLTDFNGFVDRAVAAAHATQQGNQQVDASVLRSVLVVGVVVGVVLLLLQAMFVWFAWNGRNWARIVLWVILGLGVAFGLFGLAGNSGVPGFLQGLSICQWILDLAAVVLLAMKPSNEWYRYRRWLRATGQRG
jgi:hypothetical protein